MNAAARRAAAGRGDGLLWPVSLFGERAVSSPRPTFQTARRAASVKRGAEQPGATRSALQRAWRGLRAPDLDRREHDATIVVGGEPEADTNRVVVFSAPDIGAAATWAGGAGGRRDRDRKWRLYQALLARRVRAGGGV